MKVDDVYYRFTTYNGKPELKVYTILHKSTTKNAWVAYKTYKNHGTELLYERDLNNVFFSSILGAASNIYEQYRLRQQQGINSEMINLIVNWDYFQELLETEPAIMI